MINKTIISIFIISSLAGIYGYIDHQEKQQQIISNIENQISEIKSLEEKWMRWHDVYNTSVNSCNSTIYKYASNSQHSIEVDKCVRKSESLALSNTGYSKSRLLERQNKNRNTLKKYIRNNENHLEHAKSKLDEFEHNIDGGYRFNKSL